MSVVGVGVQAPRGRVLCSVNVFQSLKVYDIGRTEGRMEDSIEVLVSPTMWLVD